MPPWELLESHFPRVYRFAYRLTANAEQAEDLAQETMLRAWEKQSQLKNAASARVWLFQILVNLWRDQLRREQNRPSANGPVESALDLLPNPEALAENREELERVIAGFDGLPARQKEVLHLFAVEDLSAGEIADVLGITKNSVKVNLSAARKKLRERFPLHDPRSRETDSK